MGFCERKNVECECLTDHSVCNSDNCHRKLPDVKLRNEKNRLTSEANTDLAENQRQIRVIYNQWRDKGYSIEEVYYMISTAAHQCILEEALLGRRR